MARDPGAPSALLRLREFRDLDYFTLLKVAHDAGPEEVRQAFLRLARQWHPNLHAQEREEVRRAVTEIFILINHAQRTLSDPAKLASYRARVARGPSLHRPLAPTPAQAIAMRDRPIVRPAMEIPAAHSRPTVPTPRPIDVDAARIAARRLVELAGRAAPVGRAVVPTPPPISTGVPLPNAATPGSAPAAPSPVFEDERERELRIGLNLLDAVDFKLARARFEQMLARNRRDVRAKCLLEITFGLEQQLKGQLEAAAGHYRRAVLVDGECVEAKTALASVVELLDAAKPSDEPKKGSFLRKLFYDE